MLHYHWVFFSLLEHVYQEPFKNICKDIILMMFLLIDKPFASKRNISISLWQSLKPVSKVAVWWKHLDLFVRRTSMEVPFVDLTQVMSVIKVFDENGSHKLGR